MKKIAIAVVIILSTYGCRSHKETCETEATLNAEYAITRIATDSLTLFRSLVAERPEVVITYPDSPRRVVMFRADRIRDTVAVLRNSEVRTDSTATHRAEIRSKREETSRTSHTPFYAGLAAGIALAFIARALIRTVLRR